MKAIKGTSEGYTLELNLLTDVLEEEISACTHTHTQIHTGNKNSVLELLLYYVLFLIKIILLVFDTCGFSY